MATGTRNGTTFTLTLTDDEAATLDGLDALDENGLLGYIMLWISEKTPYVLKQRFDVLLPAEKAIILSTMASATLASKGRRP